MQALEKLINGVDELDELELGQLAKLSKSQFARLVKQIKGEKTYYRYMLTFTLDPKKNQFTDSFFTKVESYIVKQLHRKPLGIIKAYLIREGGDNDKHVHWHSAVLTDKPLKADRFNYYKKLYGNLDLSRTKAQNLEETLNYMSKQAIPKQII